jgi:hypothetical protein
VRSLSGLGGGFGSGAGAGPLLSDEPGAQPSAEAEGEEEGDEEKEEEEKDSDEGVHDEICGGGHGFADRAEETELSARHGKKEQTASKLLGFLSALAFQPRPLSRRSSFWLQVSTRFWPLTKAAPTPLSAPTPRNPAL